MSIERRESGTWHLLVGAAIGVALGLLFAPKVGKETREELGEWGRRNRERGRALLARINAMIPGGLRAAIRNGRGKGSWRDPGSGEKTERRSDS